MNLSISLNIRTGVSEFLILLGGLNWEQGLIREGTGETNVSEKTTKMSD